MVQSRKGKQSLRNQQKMTVSKRRRVNRRKRTEKKRYRNNRCKGNRSSGGGPQQRLRMLNRTLGRQQPAPAIVQQEPRPELEPEPGPELEPEPGPEL